MKLGLVQKQEQKLILTQTMQQSLAILQMPLPELSSYLESAVLSNPLVDLDYETEESFPAEDKRLAVREDYSRQRAELGIQGDGKDYLENLGGSTEESFTQMLLEQLLLRPQVAENTKRLCSYLINCLDERGYLRFPLEELAIQLSVPLAEVKAALKLLQELEPLGVGARNLEECLLLQLDKKSGTKNAKIVVQHGLELLAKHDYKGLQELLHTTRQAVEDVVELISSLNPIPSQGYSVEEHTLYQVPEAEIRQEGQEITIIFNRAFLPKLNFNKILGQLLQESREKQNLSYYKNAVREAKQLAFSLDNRQSTMERLLKLLVKKQQAFFLGRGPLVPLTMQEIGEHLGLNVSTVSRAVQDKSIVFRGRSMALKSFFLGGIPQTEGTVSREAIKEKIRLLVQNEDKEHPLSDEGIVMLLHKEDVRASRRVIAKYREELHIPGSSKRKKS